MATIKPIRMAFGHKARVGKDTALEYITAKYGCTLVRFAAPVYAIADGVQRDSQYMYVSTIEELVNAIFSDIDKHTGIWVKHREQCGAVKTWIRRVLLPKILQEDGCGKPGIKVPWLLQMIGTDLRNIVHEDIWVNVVHEQITKALKDDPNVNIVCADMRFPNEYALLESLGWVLVRVNRANRPIDRDPNHYSEIALDNHDYHWIINNDGTLDEYRDKLQEILDVETNWSHAEVRQYFNSLDHEQAALSGKRYVAPEATGTKKQKIDGEFNKPI